jgi:(1->4)-alpha-D-glucan 1-alpha-D-glucosylmutase
MSAPVSPPLSEVEPVELAREAWTRTLELLAKRRHVPLSTYRVQLNNSFTFQQAASIIGYLERLGISDLYASPYFRARRDSTHGYDITDHNSLNPSIGTEDDYLALVEALSQRGMHQILDMVPNHMGIGEPANTWWMDVLEHGEASVFAPHFDIDWRPLNPKLAGRVLLPVLGDQYGDALERGELRLSFDAEEGCFRLTYFEHLFPVNPRSYLYILEPMVDGVCQALGADSDAAAEFRSILTALTHLPRRHETEPARRLERRREVHVLKRRLIALAASDARLKLLIDARVGVVNGAPGDPTSFDTLHALLEEQAYRLSFWRVAAEEINYRRFFDINDLVAVRIEEPHVFAATHRMLFRLLATGRLHGLRIDHVDGLRDPAQYLTQLQRGYFAACAESVIEAMNVSAELRGDVSRQLLARYDQSVADAPHDAVVRPLYVSVEKILGHGEELPTDWPVAGTTGYDFTNDVTGLFIAADNARAFADLYRRYTGIADRFPDLAYAKKLQIMRMSLASEVTVLTNLLNRVSEQERRWRDFTISSLRVAIRETIACFPVYRTYITPRETQVSERDRGYIERAIRGARRRNPALEPTVFQFLQDVLLLREIDRMSPQAARARWEFVLKFQQVTSPVMAKGLEDTAFYVYNRLVALNEVGGEPGLFGIGPEEFHKKQAERQRSWPAALLASSTHDTKRAEDARARISVLSEVPREWEAALERWTNANPVTDIDSVPAPDRNEQYLFYQTLLGVWPFSGLRSADDVPEQEYSALIERIQAYFRKALNEAKVNSSWVNENADYHEHVAGFIRRCLDRGANSRFLADFTDFARRLALFGAQVSLAQTLIKLTSPGIPDTYQGTELWDLSLVDPDNRRPVDYAHRASLLERLDAMQPSVAPRLLDDYADGAIKLYVTSRALRARRAHESVFRDGSYAALPAEGSRARQVFAYARSFEPEQFVVVVPRLVARDLWEAPRMPCGAFWGDTSLPLTSPAPGRYRDVFTGSELHAHHGRLALAQVLETLPIALLERLS